jgi:hypothetical protein
LTPRLVLRPVSSDEEAAFPPLVEDHLCRADKDVPALVSLETAHHAHHGQEVLLGAAVAVFGYEIVRIYAGGDYFYEIS